MTNHTAKLSKRLEAAWSRPQIQELDADTFVVSVPTHRFEHDLLPLIVRREDAPDRPWIISDDGHIAFLLGDQWDVVREAVSDTAAISADVAGTSLTMRSTDDAVGDAVVGFAREVGALLVAANTLDAYIAGRRAAQTAANAARVMAREVKYNLERAVPKLKGLYRVDRPLRYAHLTVRVPLAVNGPSGDAGVPLVVASMVDLGNSRTERFALGTTSLVLDIAEELGLKRRFVVVRGDEQRASELADLYGKREAHVMTTTALEPLFDAASELQRELLGA